MGKIVISENVSLDGLAASECLFDESGDKKPMRLARIQTVGDDLAFLTYQRVQAA
jgi:hypothetical protein